MEIGAALLCDAATVREGLINVLGGGITRMHRDSFPAPVSASLAMVLLLHKMEQAQPHEVRIIVQDADGKLLAEARAGFEASVSPGSDPVEKAYVPLVLPLSMVSLEKPGMYSVEVSIDGHHQRSISFRALLREQPKPPDSAESGG